MISRTRTISTLLMISQLILCSSAIGASPAQKKDKPAKAKKQEGDKKKSEDAGKPAPAPHAVIWQEPTDIDSRDLFYGPGGAEGAPDPNGKFTFVSRSGSGTSEKIHVTDDKGRKWVVKFGAETKPETSATRIVWAAGYHTDQDYFVKRAHIEGRGGFDVRDVRFERSDDGFKEDGLWAWQQNPFNGTRELQGLKVLMALLNNWDLKTENNKVIKPDKKSGGDRDVRIYYVADLGGTLGSTGSFFRKIPGFGSAPAGSKGNPDSYSAQPFIEGVRNGEVVFHYKGKDPKALAGVTVENARWMGGLLGRLTDKQLSDAFRAGGFADSEVTTYTRAIRARINELKNLK
jgi:ribosomal protein L12E/L44/L45/RPP1/RPP2